MRVHGGADGQVFVEVQASQGQNGPDVWKTGWPPVSPKALLDGAYDTAKAYTDEWVQAFEENAASGGDDWGTFDLATAILGKDAVDRIVAQSAQDKRVLKDLVDLEWAIIDAINGEAMSGFVRPDIGFKSMDDGLNGYFDPDAGRIWLSHDIQTWDADARDRVVLEELGEALAAHVEANELEPDKGEVLGEGDVGNRLMKVFLGEPFEDEDFIAKGSDTALVSVGEGGEDEVEASAEEDLVLEIDVPEDTRTPEELAAEWGVNVDTVTGMIPIAETITDGPPWTAESFAEVEGWDLVVGAYGTDGVMTFNNLLRAFVEQAVYLGQSGSNPDIPGRGDPGVVPESLPDLELAAEWGHPLSDVSEARAIAREIYDRNGFTGDQGFTLGDHDSITWDPMIRIYGQDAATDTNDPVLQVDELARAITEGAFTTTVNSAGEVVFDAVNLESVSTTTIVDATWAYVERDSGGERTNITAAHLKEASDYIVGQVMATDVLVTDGEEAPVEPLSIFGYDHYGLIEGLFADEASDNGTVDRFSKEAIQSIWDTGVFLQSKDFPENSNLHPIPGFGEIGYALSEENAAAVTPAEPTDPVEDEDALTDPVHVDDGQWHDFGYYGDGDTDAVLNGVDDDTGASYDLVDIPATAEFPAGAELTEIVDFNWAEAVYGVQSVRTVRYVDPTTDAEVFAVIDMTQDSATIGQVLSKIISHVDTSVEMHDINADAPYTFAVEDIAEMATENEAEETEDGRRLTDGYASASEEELVDYVATTFPDSTYLESFGHNNIAWVKYQRADGTTYIKFKYAEVQSYGEYMAKRLDPVYGDIVEDGDGWDAFTTAAGISDTVPDLEAEWLDTVPGVADGVGGKILADWSAKNAMQTTFQAARSTEYLGSAYFAEKAINFFDKGIGAMFTQDMADTNYLAAMDEITTTDTIDGEENSPVDEADETDPGVVGTGYSAYGIPFGVTLQSAPEFLEAEDGPYGVDTMTYVYKYDDDDDTLFSVAVDVSDPAGERYGLVLQAVKVDINEDEAGLITNDYTYYDSTGNETQGATGVDLDPVLNEFALELLDADYDEEVAHITAALPEGAVLTDEPPRVTGHLTSVEFTVPGEEGTRVWMMEKSFNDDGTVHYSHHEASLLDTADQLLVEAFDQAQDMVDRVITFILDHSGEVEIARLSTEILNYLLPYVNVGSLSTVLALPATVSEPQQSAILRLATGATAVIPGLFNAMGAVSQLDFGLPGNLVSYAMNELAFARNIGWAAICGRAGDVVQAPASNNPVAEAPQPLLPDTPTFTSALDGVSTAVGADLGKEIFNNNFALMDLPPEVFTELEATAASGPTTTIGGMTIVDLRENTALMESMETMANNVFDGFKDDIGLSDKRLKLGTAEVRTFGSNGGATHLHQDTENNGLVMGVTLPGYDPLEAVPKSEMGKVQRAGREAFEVVPGETVEYQEVGENQMILFGGSDRFLPGKGEEYDPNVYNAGVHRSPANSANRPIGLFRWVYEDI